jgi:hypothetical protein
MEDGEHRFLNRPCACNAVFFLSVLDQYNCWQLVHAFSDSACLYLSYLLSVSVERVKFLLKIRLLL